MKRKKTLLKRLVFQTTTASSTQLCSRFLFIFPGFTLVLLWWNRNYEEITRCWNLGEPFTHNLPYKIQKKNQQQKNEEVLIYHAHFESKTKKIQSFKIQEEIQLKGVLENPNLPHAQNTSKQTSISLTMLIWSNFFKIAISWYIRSRGAIGFICPLAVVFDPRGGGRPLVMKLKDIL